MKILFFIVLITVLAVGFLPAYAVSHGHGGFHGHGHGHGHFFFSGNVLIGPGWGPWWWGAPYYSYYPYNSYYPYSSASVGLQQESQEYMQRAPQQEQLSYWYYCPNPQGYYPYVKECSKGWMKVVPAPAPEGLEE